MKNPINENKVSQAERYIAELASWVDGPKQTALPFHKLSELPEKSIKRRPKDEQTPVKAAPTQRLSPFTMHDLSPVTRFMPGYVPDKTPIWEDGDV